MDLRKLGAKQTMEMKMLHWILEAVACVAVLLRGGLWLPTLFRSRATYALCQCFFAPRPRPWACVGCLLSFDDLAKLVSILRWSRGVAKEAELRFLAVIRSPATPHNHVRICTEQAVQLCSFEGSLQMVPCNSVDSQRGSEQRWESVQRRAAVT